MLIEKSLTISLHPVLNGAQEIEYEKHDEPRPVDVQVRKGWVHISVGREVFTMTRCTFFMWLTVSTNPFPSGFQLRR